MNLVGGKHLSQKACRFYLPPNALTRTSIAPTYEMVLAANLSEKWTRDIESTPENDRGHNRGHARFKLNAQLRLHRRQELGVLLGLAETFEHDFHLLDGRQWI